MTLRLVLTLSGVERYYGNVPEIGCYKDKYEEYQINGEENEESLDFYLDEHFFMPVNELCDSLLSYCDVDYLNAKQLKKIIPYVEKNKEKEKREDVVKFYNKLLEYANRAIHFDTGIIFDSEP